MKFQQLASSSTANAYVLTLYSGKRILIECGLPWRKLIKKLDYNLNGIDACLISHCHKDHARSAIDCLTSGIPVIASAGTLQAMGIDEAHNIIAVKPLENCERSKYSVVGFPINHDAAEPFGFLILDHDTDDKFMFVTDTGYIEQHFTYEFSIIAIECSYQHDILSRRQEEGTIHEELAKRILFTHMERDVLNDYLTNYVNMTKLKELHLLHLSADNLNVKETKKMFEERFLIKVVTRYG